MKPLLFLFFSFLPLAAHVQQVQVRVVSIEKPGATTSLEAAQPDCDERLYASLIAAFICLAISGGALGTSNLVTFMVWVYWPGSGRSSLAASFWASSIVFGPLSA